jgi:hypothetical protein
MQDDQDEQPLVSRIISQLANYEGFAMPAQPSPDGQGKAKVRQQQKLGTVLGVFFPCVQNIFGIILFVRMVWLVGTAGILQGFTVVFICCLSVSTSTPHPLPLPAHPSRPYYLTFALISPYPNCKKY